jgi:hypothetical protein
MNFTTDLPKAKPVVSYIVASAVKCAKYFPEAQNEGPCFRMHAVVLKDASKATMTTSSRAADGTERGQRLHSLSHPQSEK